MPFMDRFGIKMLKMRKLYFRHRFEKYIHTAKKEGNYLLDNLFFYHKKAISTGARGMINF